MAAASDRLFLHCRQIVLMDWEGPGAHRRLVAPLPPHMQSAWADLGFGRRSAQAKVDDAFYQREAAIPSNIKCGCFVCFFVVFCWP